MSTQAGIKPALVILRIIRHQTLVLTSRCLGQTCRRTLAPDAKSHARSAKPLSLGAQWIYSQFTNKNRASVLMWWLKRHHFPTSRTRLAAVACRGGRTAAAAAAVGRKHTVGTRALLPST